MLLLSTLLFMVAIHQQHTKADDMLTMLMGRHVQELKQMLCKQVKLTDSSMTEKDKNAASRLRHKCDAFS